MRFEIREAKELTTRDRDALRRLSHAVYPPEVDAAWPGRGIEWEAARWFVLCWDDEGHAVALVGVHLRDGRANEETVCIGGIGGVKTHPEARRQGLASRAIAMAIAFLTERGAQFGVLTCEPDLVPFYERLGWRLYAGDVFVTQRRKRERFTFDRTMTLPLTGEPPQTGAIDLLGPPW